MSDNNYAVLSKWYVTGISSGMGHVDQGWHYDVTHYMSEAEARKTAGEFKQTYGSRRDIYVIRLVAEAKCEPTFKECP